MRASTSVVVAMASCRGADAWKTRPGEASASASTEQRGGGGGESKERDEAESTMLGGLLPCPVVPFGMGAGVFLKNCEGLPETTPVF